MNNSSLLQGLSLSKIIGGLNKTLNVVNQAIPLYQKLKPILGNAKDLLNVVNIINTPENIDNKKDDDIKNNKVIEAKKVSTNLPTFFQ